jgi:hypothetical protein
MLTRYDWLRVGYFVNIVTIHVLYKWKFLGYLANYRLQIENCTVESLQALLVIFMMRVLSPALVILH